MKENRHYLFFALNGKSSGGNDSTILTIPEGYRPPISFEQLVGSIDRSTLNSAQLSIGADGAIKWRRNPLWIGLYLCNYLHDLERRESI